VSCAVCVWCVCHVGCVCVCVDEGTQAQAQQVWCGARRVLCACDRGPHCYTVRTLQITQTRHTPHTAPHLQGRARMGEQGHPKWVHAAVGWWAQRIVV
jgi:hypothetical protein